MSTEDVIKELRSKVESLKATVKTQTMRIAELENVLMSYQKIASEKVGGTE